MFSLCNSVSQLLEKHVIIQYWYVIAAEFNIIT